MSGFCAGRGQKWTVGARVNAKITWKLCNFGHKRQPWDNIEGNLMRSFVEGEQGHGRSRISWIDNACWINGNRHNECSTWQKWLCSIDRFIVKQPQRCDMKRLSSKSLFCFLFCRLDFRSDWFIRANLLYIRNDHPCLRLHAVCSSMPTPPSVM